MIKNKSAAAAVVLLAAINAFASELTAPPSPAAPALASFALLSPPEPGQATSALGSDDGSLANSETTLADAVGASESCIKGYPASGDSDKMTQVLKDRGACLAQADGNGDPTAPSASSPAAAAASPSASPSSSRPSLFAAPSDIENTPRFKKKKSKSDPDSPGPKRSFGPGNLMNALPFGILGALIATLLCGPVGIAVVGGIALAAGYALSASTKIDYSDN
jgi:hypothetical protein